MSNELKSLVNQIKLRWANRKDVKTGWFSNTASKFSEAVPFFMKVIDELMKFMDNYDMPGLSKKALVMESLNELYDYIVGPLLPLWLKPFGSNIKSLVLDVLVSTFIDFLVARIREVKLT